MYIVQPLCEPVYWQTQTKEQQKKKRAARNTFSIEEDKKLNDLVAQYGMDWKQIAIYMPGRNARQVKERWRNYLSSDVEYRPWTSDEDDLLYKKYREFGPRWKEISRFFEKRTEVHVKNRWRLLQRAELRKARESCKEVLKQANHQRLPIPRSAKIWCATQKQADSEHVFEVGIDTDPWPSDSFIEDAWEMCDDSFSWFMSLKM